MLLHSSVLFSPLVSTPVIGVLAGVAAVTTLMAMMRRARGAKMRGTLSALILLLLLNPSLVQEERKSQPDTVLIVRDDSQSLHLGQRPALMQDTLNKITSSLQSLSDVTTETITVTGEKDTRLLTALAAHQATSSMSHLAAVLLLTDGQVHDTDGFGAEKLGAPVHSLILGNKHEQDRRLSVTQAPTYGVVGKSITAKLRLTDNAPHSDGATVPLTVTADDGHSIDVRAVIGQDTSIELPIRHGGKNHFVIESPVRDGELVRQNNTVLLSVQGVRDRLRVLLISSQPHIGGRTWRDFLKSDPSVDLVHFTLLRSQAQYDGTPDKELALIAFPVPQLFGEKLSSFDLVIFDRYRNAMPIPDHYLANLATTVKKGGALLLTTATDQPSAMLSVSPLAPILPAPNLLDLATHSFIPALTGLGRHHPVTAALPNIMPENNWGPWYRLAKSGQVASGKNSSGPNSFSQGAGQVLMTGGDDNPLLILSRVGEGRVAEMTSDQIWLWSRGHQGGGPAEELLRRIAHWLMKEPELDDEALTSTVTATDQGWHITLTAPTEQATQKAKLFAPDVSQSPINFIPAPDHNLYTATLDVKGAGLYRIVRGDQVTILPVGLGVEQELDDVLPTTEHLGPISKATGGGIYRIMDTGDIPALRRTSKQESQAGQSWAGLRRNNDFIVTGSHTIPLIPPLLAFLALLTLLALIWWREGKSSR